MPIKLIMPVMGFALFATSAAADVTPPWWCFDTPDRGQFCGHYKATTAELASIRAADEAEAKMCIGAVQLMKSWDEFLLLSKLDMIKHPPSAFKSPKRYFQ